MSHNDKGIATSMLHCNLSTELYKEKKEAEQPL